MTSNSKLAEETLVTIVDYDAGNILNAFRAVKHIGFKVELAASPAEVSPETKVLMIPGVGAFGQGMQNLNDKKFVPFIDQWVAADKPLVGICLGMQLLFQESCEMGQYKGLGYLKGKMDKIPVQMIDGKKFPVPHVGWAGIKMKTSDSVSQCYFVHSYYAVDTDPNEVIGWGEYGHVKIPAIVGRKNILGFQFHPEKSAEYGLSLLQSSILSIL